MSFLIDKDTRLIIQGITGREGSFHCKQILEYGTNVVAGVTPGKGGMKVEGVPVYNTVREAMERHEANATILFVPPNRLYEGAYESISTGIPLVIIISEGTPVYDMYRLYHFARNRGVRLIGPNSFGIISPGKAKAGFMAHKIFSEGSVGIMSRSATNAYETVYMLSKAGFGQSTVVGIGGDMIPGSTFSDLLPFYEKDEQTKVIVLIGEIGGSEEERAAEYIATSITKPVIALIAGKNAPKEQSMGHAGAIIAPNGEGSAQLKEKKLREAGALIAESTSHIPPIVKKLLSSH